MARRYIVRGKEEKLAIVKEVLLGKALRAWEAEIRHEAICDWVKKYQSEGEAGLEPKKKPGNPLSRCKRRKGLTYEERLLYQIELLKQELLKKEAEAARLKRQSERKKGGAQRK